MWNEWILKSNTIPFGRLVKSPFLDEKVEEINGFCVSGIYRYSYEDTIEYDKKHKTNYATNWCPGAISKGYIYLIEFSGYGKTN